MDEANFNQSNMDWANMDWANMDWANTDQSIPDQINVDQVNIDQANMEEANAQGFNMEEANNDEANNEQQLFHVPRGAYDLDNVYLPQLIANNHPAQRNSTITCYFRAIPVRGLRINFRELAEYGDVTEESAEKLIITLFHRDIQLMLSVVKQAWVSKYLELGDICVMQFGTLIPYKDVRVIFQRLNATAPLNMQSGMEIPQQYFPPVDAAPPNAPEEDDEELDPSQEQDRRLKIQKSHVDFFSEINAQFREYGIEFPPRWGNSNEFYGGYDNVPVTQRPGYQRDPAAMARQGHQDLAHQEDPRVAADSNARATYLSPRAQAPASGYDHIPLHAPHVARPSRSPRLEYGSQTSGPGYRSVTPQHSRRSSTPGYGRAPLNGPQAPGGSQLPYPNYGAQLGTSAYGYQAPPAPQIRQARQAPHESRASQAPRVPQGTYSGHGSGALMPQYNYQAPMNLSGYGQQPSMPGYRNPPRQNHQAPQGAYSGYGAQSSDSEYGYEIPPARQARQAYQVPRPEHGPRATMHQYNARTQQTQWASQSSLGTPGPTSSGAPQFPQAGHTPEASQAWSAQVSPMAHNDAQGSQATLGHGVPPFPPFPQVPTGGQSAWMHQPTMNQGPQQANHPQQANYPQQANHGSRDLPGSQLWYPSSDSEPQGNGAGRTGFVWQGSAREATVKELRKERKLQKNKLKRKRPHDQDDYM